jgi:hypothetical protein
MKDNLDNEEKEILNAYENNDFIEVPEMEAEIKNHVEYAKLTFLKNKRINK